MPWDDLERLGKLGLGGGLLLLAFLFYTKRVRFGWQYDELQERNTQLEKQIAKLVSQLERCRKAARKGHAVLKHAVHMVDEVAKKTGLTGDKPDER
jgi:Tfp pilus assembly protein PilN